MAAVPTDADRTRLEGRLEVLEQALGWYERAWALLRPRTRWRPRLAEARATLRMVGVARGNIDEALERVAHLARVEAWPASHPVLRLASRVEALRQRVEARVQERLVALRVRTSETSFVERVDQLDARLRTLRPAPPAWDEPVLLRGGMGQVASVAGIVLSALVPPYLVGLATALSLPAVAPLGVAALANVAVAGGRALRSGRYVLTTRRLTWTPFLGDGDELGLEALQTSTVTWDRRAAVLRIDGPRLVELRHVEHPDSLAAGLALLRHPPFRQGLGSAAGVVFEAWQVEARRHGAVLVCPTGVAFVPDGAAAYQAVTGAAGPWHPAQAALLLRAVQHLPEDRRHGALGALSAVEGAAWLRPEALVDRVTWQHRFFTLGIPGGAVTAALGERDSAEVAHLLRTLVPRTAWAQPVER